MGFVSYTDNSILDNAEYGTMIATAKKQQLAVTKIKIDKFNEIHEMLIRQVKEEEVILQKRKKIQALRYAKQRLQTQN